MGGGKGEKGEGGISSSLQSCRTLPVSLVMVCLAPGFSFICLQEDAITAGVRTDLAFALPALNCLVLCLCLWRGGERSA